jgi:hypothetical protein
MGGPFCQGEAVAAGRFRVIIVRFALTKALSAGKEEVFPSSKKQFDARH